MKDLKAFAITFYVVTLVIAILILGSICINAAVDMFRGLV